MFPTLFKIGPLTLHTYGLMVAAGFLLGLFWTSHEARKAGRDVEKIFDLVFYLFIVAMIASRIVYVIMAWENYRHNLLGILKFWEGGLVFYGGLIPAVIAGVLYLRLKKIPVFETGDIIAPGLAVAQAVGRLGCLAAGCCYGRPTDAPWGIVFSNPNCLAQPLGEPLHPTQLYSSLFLFALFGLLVFLRKHKLFAGQVFLTYATLHGVFRLIVEYFRGDFRGATILGLFTITQMAALTLVIVSLILMVYLYLGKKKE